MWGHASTNDKYLKTNQIKYGQKIEGFNTWRVPTKLQKNVKYIAYIGMPGVAFPWHQTFTIINGNKVIIPHYVSRKLPKNRFVIIEKDGKKIAVPYTVNFIKNKEGEIEKKVITSHPERGRIIEE